MLTSISGTKIRQEKTSEAPGTPLLVPASPFGESRSSSPWSAPETPQGASGTVDHGMFNFGASPQTSRTKKYRPSKAAVVGGGHLEPSIQIAGLNE